MTGYDEAVPAGRDLTANDVRDALRSVGVLPLGSDVGDVADRLNGIARPSGGVGQQRECVHPELDGPCSGCSPRSWSLPAPPPDDVPPGPWYIADDGRSFKDARGLYVPWRPEVVDFVRDAVNAAFAVVEGEPPAPARCGNCGVLLDQDHYGDDDGIGLCWSCRELGPAPEPQAAEPPRFERGFYRLARDLDVGPDTVSAGSLIFLASVEHNGTHGAVHGVSALARTSLAALAAAGAVRVEER